jgi:hypothetical protein
MVYWRECRPFCSAWSGDESAVLRLGNQRFKGFALAIVFHVGGRGAGGRMVSGCGKSLRNMRCRGGQEALPALHKHGSMGSLLVADGHGGNCPRQTIRSTYAVRQRLVDRVWWR